MIRTLKKTPKPKTVKDPVCGMRVDRAGSAGEVRYLGSMYLFCSQYCVDAFTADPATFVSTASPPSR